MDEKYSITKEEATRLYGGNQAALARALNIGRAAVSKWPNGPIPELYALRIRFIIFPDRFANIV
ncbi:MAG: hypothetical protein KAT62_02530 [Desulfuromonadales bacterium]|nr:hypothetical protein [Desulfuromonadales bacterium]